MSDQGTSTVRLQPTPTPMSRLFTRVQVQAGVARRDITPPVDIYFRSWGAALRDNADGVHRPFSVTALVLRENAAAPPVVLIAVDAGWWQDGADEMFVRGSVLEALDLGPAAVMINLSHTHAGPSMATGNADKPGGQLIAPYLDLVRTQIVAASREALAAAADCELVWATGRCDLATQRSLPDPSGGRYVTGYHPDGSADDTLMVGRLTDRAGKQLATIVNYACHPTTLAWDNTKLSPDYIGAMRETVEAATDGAPCMFLLGAAGEMAPAWQYEGDVAVADKHGRRLGLAVRSTLEGMLEPGSDLVYEGVVESGAPLGVWRSRPVPAVSHGIAARRVELSLPVKSDYPTLEVITRELAAATEPYLIERWSRKARLRRTLGDADTYRFSVWVWKVGDSFLVGYPGEAFTTLQRDLRSAFPDHRIIVMNVTNGSIGYLPPDELYDYDMYEVWQTPLDRGCHEAIRDACLATIGDLARKH